MHSHPSLLPSWELFENIQNRQMTKMDISAVHSPNLEVLTSGQLKVQNPFGDFDTTKNIQECWKRGGCSPLFWGQLFEHLSSTSYGPTATGEMIQIGARSLQTKLLLNVTPSAFHSVAGRQRIPPHQRCQAGAVDGCAVSIPLKWFQNCPKSEDILTRLSFCWCRGIDQ